jgi:hypothetical protein
MNSKFFVDLDLKSGRHIVAASGPCNWGVGDASAVLTDVRVTRNSVVASSAGSTTVKSSDPGWALAVSSPDILNPGPAHGRATALVTRANGTTYQFSWYDTDVKLREFPP